MPHTNRLCWKFSPICTPPTSAPFLEQSRRLKLDAITGSISDPLLHVELDASPKLPPKYAPSQGISVLADAAPAINGSPIRAMKRHPQFLFARLRRAVRNVNPMLPEARGTPAPRPHRSSPEIMAG